MAAQQDGGGTGASRIRRAGPIQRAAFAAACLAGLLGSGAATAERWRLEPAANLETGYDDNVRLTSSDAEDAFSVNLNAILRGIRSSEVSDVGFAVGLAGSRYPGVTDLDNDSGFANLDLAYRLERQQYRLGLGFTSQSTLTSEVATTGLVQVNQQQNSLTVNPGWGYQLTERATLDLAANYQEVTYEDSRVLPLYDYRAGSVELRGGYAYTERLSLTGQTGLRPLRDPTGPNQRIRQRRRDGRGGLSILRDHVPVRHGWRAAHRANARGSRRGYPQS